MKLKEFRYYLSQWKFTPLVMLFLALTLVFFSMFNLPAGEEEKIPGLIEKLSITSGSQYELPIVVAQVSLLNGEITEVAIPRYVVVSEGEPVVVVKQSNLITGYSFKYAGKQ